jgi:hypothetical protein
MDTIYPAKHVELIFNEDAEEFQIFFHPIGRTHDQEKYPGVVLKVCTYDSEKTLGFIIQKCCSQNRKFTEEIIKEILYKGDDTNV